ncbi:RagB/SusD family nutrient uptake outer membrane protein [Sphingobacterium sp. DN00404]|uniref:RagB/SusD family nutrient uptake outer membrane protein n=1 Tax=Sphingobacterium micropteri TaxID=2763501 RepID=A0ABR7YKY3_9SPHI|nr:RagB/SusD family nutrient uptake outer membrane protein [Sphingobacterium micropteri]MBD1431975.1 RagB/SusD family nutrient uptake outer membrane protein [Sphingobacterium micropteri]
MKKLVVKIGVFCCVLNMLSCNDFLAVTPDNVGTIDHAFRNRNEAENYLFSCYAYLQRAANLATDPAFTTSGELIYPNNLIDYLGFNRGGFNVLRGFQSAASPALNTWNGENGSYNFFRSIRLCNNLMDNIDKPIDLTEAEKRRWIAEAKFLKAYYHFYLMRMYGPIPLMKENLPINSTTEEVRVYRNSVDEVVEYIVELLEEAIPDLPESIQNINSELGRATKVIALGLKADVLMTAASPLFNGNPDYAQITDNTGKFLFSQVFDNEKWKIAADACLAAIQESEQLQLRLYTFVNPPNIGTLSDSLRTVLSIQNSVTERWDQNPEFIWPNAPSSGYQGFATPRLTALAVNNAWSNPGTFSAPISMQELFYSDKGVPINEDRTWDYGGRYSLKTAEAEDRFFVKEGYTTVKAHFGREARFYASLAFDGGVWFGNDVYNQENAYFVQARGTAAFAGPKDMVRLNITGYWPKKLVHYQSVYDDGFRQVEFHLPIIRLAGLYLWYAEALNEYYGPTNEEIFLYLDAVRERAGLEGVREAWTKYSRIPNKPNTKEGLRSIIHQERRIELCFEARAGWDLRRWKEMQEALSEPFQGWSIYQGQAENYYRPVTQFMPIFGLKDYLWPIKSYDLIQNPNLVQNPYW